MLGTQSRGSAGRQQRTPVELQQSLDLVEFVLQMLNGFYGDKFNIYENDQSLGLRFLKNLKITIQHD